MKIVNSLHSNYNRFVALFFISAKSTTHIKCIIFRYQWMCVKHAINLITIYYHRYNCANKLNVNYYTIIYGNFCGTMFQQFRTGDVCEHIVYGYRYAVDFLICSWLVNVSSDLSANIFVIRNSLSVLLMVKAYQKPSHFCLPPILYLTKKK